MKRLLTLTCVLLAPAVGHAQFNRPATSGYLPTPPPRVTPYLGLLNSGNPAANYYLIVQPQVRRGLDSQLLGQNYSLDALSQGDARAPNDGELSFVPVQPQSGHGAGFGLTAPFFQFPSRGRSFVPYNGQAPAALPAPRTTKKF